MFDYIKADLQRHLCCDGRESNSIIWTLFIIVFAYGFHTSSVYRYGRFIDQRLKYGRLSFLYPLANIFYSIGKLLTEKMYGIAINRNAVIAEGFYIGHFGGIELGSCQIGKNCNVHQQVKVGDGCVLGDYVWVGAHAVLEDGLKVADHATIMVGARVSSPVGKHCLASGNPARIINKNYDNSRLLGIKEA
ncbi:hypothetical protein [Desulforhopalus sp. IMCC35007]|uniref:hypothetical protein n=1 Tax=Desulforhopalus sp. IMCC35007 TaxID=2569543 RepID=UPI0010AE3775|nr:hypothetical protein [Desulforhopalus sp. IMCC35007]TKB07424.1 hypothetical protein FCL48_16925 [Desulforhopalus sp. IMCC35007]